MRERGGWGVKREMLEHRVATSTRRYIQAGIEVTSLSVSLSVSHDYDSLSITNLKAKIK